MAKEAESAAAPLDVATRLAARLPAEGPILALGGLAAASTPRPDSKRLALGSDGTVPRAALEPHAWRAIVVAPDSPLRDWPALLSGLRGALVEGGRLFVVLPLDDGAAASAAAAEAVAALLETGFCVVDERTLGERTLGERAVADRLASDSDRAAAPARTLLVEARPDEHLVRSFREGDETAILELFSASFSPSRGHDHWRWKYRNNPFGALAVSCAFAANGDLVAHYAAYPVRWRRSRTRIGEALLCHQVGDTMTDRRYRHIGRGRTSLLARTARHFYARRCEGRVAWNYGFNTGNIQRFSQLFVGARKVWDIELWSCREADLRLAAKKRFRPYRASRVERLDDGFDDFFERVAPAYLLLVERRRPYLEWRYLRCPDREYHLLRVDVGSRLVGWGVFRVDGDRLLWGDALFDPEHPGAVSALLRLASAIASPEPVAPSLDAPAASPAGTAGGRRVEGWFSRHPSWWTEHLATLGFVPGPEPQGLGMVFVPFLESPDEELANGYYLAMGDSDLF